MMLVGFGDRYHLVRSRRQLCFDDDAGSIIMDRRMEWMVTVVVEWRHGTNVTPKGGIFIIIIITR